MKMRDCPSGCGTVDMYGVVIPTISSVADEMADHPPLSSDDPSRPLLLHGSCPRFCNKNSRPPIPTLY